MEINVSDIIRLKKLSHCKICKNDTFMTIKTGTEFIFKCDCCKTQKIISAKKLKFHIKEVISTINTPTILDF